MRVLEIDLGARRLELHPYVSIVRDLTDEQRATVVRTLAALPGGADAGVGGLLEAYGILLDLDAATLALLDLHAADIDPLVRTEDLPGAGLAPAARARGELERSRAALVERVEGARLAAERAVLAHRACVDALAAASTDESPPSTGVERAAEQLAEAEAVRDRAQHAADEAVASHEQAQAGAEVAVNGVDAARRTRAEANRAVALAAGALEAARAARDPFATAALDAARERLAAESDVDGHPSDVEAESDIDEAHLNAEIERLEGERPAIVAALGALDLVDPFPVEVALRQLTDGESAEMVADPEAAAIADELRRIRDDLDAAKGGGGGGGMLAEARRRLDEARAAQFDAEQDARLPRLTPEQMSELEAAHDAVYEAQERTDRRFAGRGARERLEEARREEQAILDRLGFLTYTDFMMGTSILHVDRSKEEDLEIARQELAAAEQHLASLEANVEAELDRAGTLVRQKELYEEAARLLGHDPGDDVEGELRSRRVPLDDSADRAARLADVLRSAGMSLDGGEPQQVLVELATVWLDEQRTTTDERAALEGRLLQIEADIDDAREALRRHDDALQGEAARRAHEEERRAEQLDAVAQAEARMARAESAEREVTDRAADLDGAIASEAEAAAVLAEAESVAERAAEEVRSAAERRAQAEARLVEASAAATVAADTLAQVESRSLEMADLVASDRARLEREADTARTAADAAAAAVAAEEQALVELDRALADLQSASVEPAAHGPSDEHAVGEEIEWYLLGRLAGQRAVSYVGSVPLVLDDALTGLPATLVRSVLDRLERMAGAVQVIVLSQDDSAAAWADAVGPDRAATVQPA